MKNKSKNDLRWACFTLGWAARAFEQLRKPLFWAGKWTSHWGRTLAWEWRKDLRASTQSYRSLILMMISWSQIMGAVQSVVQKLWPILQTSSKWAPNLAKMIQLAFKIPNLASIASKISPFALPWKISLKDHLRWACLTLGWAAWAYEQP